MTRHPLQDLSIKLKLTWIITLTSVVAVALACVVFSTFEFITERIRMVRILEQRANIIGVNCDAALAFSDPKAARETLATLALDPRMIAGRLYSNEGKLFAVYERPDEKAEHPDRPEADGHRFTRGRLTATRGVFLKDNRIGTITLTQDLRALYMRLFRFLGIAWVILLGSSIVAHALASRLQGVISDPILELSMTAKAIAREGDYSARALKRGQDELGALVDEFNEMLDLIQKRDDQLRRELALNQATLEATTEGILAVDRKGKIVRSNRRFLDMWRIPEQLLAAHNDDRLLAIVLDQLKEPDMFMSRVREAYASPEEDRFETLKCNDGRVFERQSKPQRLGAEVVGCVWSFRDITERTRAEGEMRASQQRLSLLAGSSPLGVIVWDLDFRVVEWNKSAERIFGYAQAEAVGRHASFIVPEKWRAGVDKVWENLLAQRGGVRSHNENLAKEGRAIVCQWYNAPLIDSEGKVIAVASMVDDVTDHMEAEAAIRRLNADLERRVKERTALLETANKELEAFSYSVSHDLRTPLRAIEGFSQVVIEDYGGKLDDRGRNHLQRIRAATHRMSEIIDDMLTLGRVTRAELHREPVDLSRLAAEIIAEFEEGQPDRRVLCEIDPGVQVRGDPQLLRLLLENLLGNAWKFTSRTPDARIEFRSNEHQGRPVYLVRDNGVGFDPALIDKLFKPFIRLHPSAEYPGTGVGLAIVMRIVARHGGQIRAEGATGKGAAFFFTLEESIS